MSVELILVIIVGLLAGGAVNALADDLPLRRSLRLPRYVPDDKKRAIHLPHDLAVLEGDDEKRPLVAWLGLTAFLSGKRTSPNGVRLSWRYPIAELLTVFLMLITYAALRNNEKLVDIGLLQAVFWLVYMAIFALITVIDIEHKLILFVVIVPSALIALADALIGEVVGGFYQPSLLDALIGGVAGFIVFFVIYNGGFLFTYVMGKLRGREIKEIAFGYGDVMMATVSGLILGWRALIIALYLTIFLGALGAILYLVSRRLLGQKYSAFTAIPYGPYIIAGTVIALLYRTQAAELFFGK